MRRIVGRVRLHQSLARAATFAVLASITSVLAARLDSAADGARRTSAGVLALTFTRADGALAAATEDGKRTARLALPRGGFVASHAWSHDGRYIAFSRCRGKNCRQGSVYVIRDDGSGERLVIANAGGAVWMPDDQHLLVDRADKPGHWIVSLADRSRRRYAPPGHAAAPFSPRLSPDGRWLLHLAPIYGRSLPSPSAPHHARARNWLIITDLRNGRSRRVSNERGLYFLGTAPWSPDGTQFTFTQRRFLQAIRWQDQRRQPERRRSSARGRRRSPGRRVVAGWATPRIQRQSVMRNSRRFGRQHFGGKDASSQRLPADVAPEPMT